MKLHESAIAEGKHINSMLCSGTCYVTVVYRNWVPQHSLLEAIETESAL